ncbi:MAG: PAS domain-containing protein [Candidatus Sumerlaeia bacterium]|nr:PAS domain-containing protein [Candidatus Sumerlaeia bacterium]
MVNSKNMSGAGEKPDDHRMFHHLGRLASFASLDGDGRVVWATQAFCELVGREHSTGIKISELLKSSSTPEANHAKSLLLEAIRENRNWTGILQIQGPSQSLVPHLGQLHADREGVRLPILHLQASPILPGDDELFRHQMERYQLALWGANFAIYDWNVKTGVNYMSDEFYEMTHLTRDQYDGSLDSFLQRLHPDDKGEVMQSLNLLIDEGNPFDAEYRFLTGEEKWRWVRARGNAIWDDTGTLARMVGSVEDVHERKQAEEAARRVEKRFRQAIHAASGAAYELRIDDDGKRSHYVFIDEHIEDYTGVPPHKFSREGLVSMEKEIIFHDPRFDGDREKIRELFWSGKLSVYHADLKIITSKGEERWLSDHSVPVFDDKGDKVIGSLGIIMDITARKVMELRHQRQLARMELLNRITRYVAERRSTVNIIDVVLSSLRDDLPVQLAAYFTLCDDHENFTCLQHAAAMGFETTDLSGLTLDAEKLDILRLGNSIRLVPGNSAECSFSGILKAGSKGTIILAPIGATKGFMGIILVARDDGKQFESGEVDFLEQLCRHAALALEQQELYDSLEKAYQELKKTQTQLMQQERLRAMGQMASGIAHDINNALAPLTMYPEMLLATEENLSPEMRNVLGLINDSALNIAQTVSRLGELYRRREGGSENERRPVDLNALVLRLIELTRPRWRDLARQHGADIQIETNLMHDLPVVRVAESELRDAITNLFFNAIDAMPQGGTLSISTFTDDDGVHLVCQDTGHGMDDATVERCFEPFFTTKGSQGTGLGLSMVQAVVDRHHGTLTVESAPGRGTKFDLSLPLRTHMGIELESTDEMEKAILLSTVDFSNLRLLLAEDDQNVRRALATALVRDGFDVTATVSGMDALEEFRQARENQAPFDLVISDLGMPGMDGFQLARKIKELSAGTPFILLTGWGAHYGRERHVNKDVDVLLSKPPLMQEIREAVRKLIPHTPRHK